MRASTTDDSAPRAARLAEIRRQIAAGTYETPDKLAGAVDAFLVGQIGNLPVAEVARLRGSERTTENGPDA